jgi:uncharacterized protein (DUF58 family)
VRPAPAAERWLIAWLLLAVAGALWSPLLVVWVAAGAVLATVLAADAFALRGLGPCEVERDAAAAVDVATWNRVGLVVHNRGARRVNVHVHDHAPATFALSGLPRSVALAPGDAARFEYRARPLERGEVEFAPAEVLLDSPLAFWRRRVRSGPTQRVRVYPGFQRVKEYARLELDQRTSQLGVRVRPRRGVGMDFHQLREYRAGDPLRQIDWKTTARLGKAISREYQEERDQQIVVLLDCSRRMHARDGDLSHFDHALDAVLLVAHVALRKGDSFGLLCFGAEPRWLAPRKGLAHHRALTNRIYDLRTSDQPADYLALATSVTQRIRKRALLILVSNLRDEDQQEFTEAVRMLRRRHLVLVTSLRERALDTALRGPVDTFDQALEIAATHHYVAARESTRQRLRATGIRIVDAQPQELAVQLVNGYLDIKRQNLL